MTINNQQETLVNGWTQNSTVNCQNQNAAMCYYYHFKWNNNISDTNTTSVTGNYNSQYCGNFSIHDGNAFSSDNSIFPAQVNVSVHTKETDDHLHEMSKNYTNSIALTSQETDVHDMLFEAPTQSYSNWGDQLCVLSGWPLWGEWLSDNYPSRADNTSYGALLYQQPFLYYKDTKQSYTADDEHDTYYSHFGLLNYAANDLVPPYPLAVAQEPNKNGGEGTLTNIDKLSGYDRYNRSCSYPNRQAGNAWQSTFYNSWCEYVEGIDKYGTSENYALDLGVGPGGSYISGLRDVFGTAYPLQSCDGTSCKTVQLSQQ